MASLSQDRRAAAAAMRSILLEVSAPSCSQPQSASAPITWPPGGGDLTGSARALQETPQHDEVNANAGSLDSTFSPQDSLPSRPNQPHATRPTKLGGAASTSPTDRTRHVVNATQSFPLARPTYPKEGKFKMAHSFGDTQPMESQIFREFTTSMVHGDDSAFPTTYHTGDDGYVDLMDDWDGAGAGGVMPGIANQIGYAANLETQLHVHPTSDPVSLPPETPAIAGQKRNYQGETVSSVATRTPTSHLGALFGNKTKNAISLTQAFNDTQAQAFSSPLPGALPSDPVFERPSPKFNGHAPSSPQPEMLESSPVKNVNNEALTRSSAEPRNTYLTMQESQKLREQRRQEQDKIAELEAQIAEDDFETDILAEQRRDELRKRQENLESLNSKINASDNLLPTTPATMQPKDKRGPFLLSEFVHEDNEELVVLELHTDEVVPDLPAENGTNWQSKEGGVQVPMTSSRVGADASQWQASPGISRKEVEHPDHFDTPVPLPHARLSASQRSRHAPSGIPEGGSELVSIADSQPEIMETAQSRSQPSRSGHSSSLLAVRATASQSQRSSQNATASRIRVAALSSIPQHPHLLGLNREDTGTSGIPSSPPPMSDDIEEDSSDDEVALIDTNELNQHADGAASHFLKAARRTVTTSAVTDSDKQQLVHQPETITHVSGHVIPQHHANGLPAVHTSNEHGVGRQTSSSARSSQNSSGNATNTTSGFETAHTHINGSGHSVQLQSQTSGLSIPSPSNIVRTTRRLTDIAADPSVDGSNAVADDLDFDILAEDKVFNAALSGTGIHNIQSSNATDSDMSPVHPNKRRKVIGYGKRDRPPQVTRKSAVAFSAAPSAELPSWSTRSEPPAARVHFSPEPAITETHKDDDEAPVFAMPAPKTGALKRSARSVNNATRSAGRSSLTIPETDTVSSELQLNEVAKTPLLGPDQEKEADIINVTAQTKNVHSKRRTAASRSSPPAAGADETVEPSEPTSVTESKDRGRGQRRAAKNKDHPSGALAIERVEPGPPATTKETNTSGRKQKPVTPIETASRDVPSELDTPIQPGLTNDEPIVVPTRVFALFTGLKAAFYPATYLGPGEGDGPTAKVRFDDGTIVTALDVARNVRALDLHIGDLVKVDANHMRSKTYIVRGFGDKISLDDGEQQEDYPTTDIYGHANVLLAVKSRESELGVVHGEELIDVPLTNIYITHTMWIKFDDRHMPGHGHTAPSYLPAHRQIIPTSRSETPRSRRVNGPWISEQESRAASFSPASGLFASMAFTLSFTNETERDKASKNVQNHGGMLLPDGFDVLFQLPQSFDDAGSAKTSPRKEKHANAATGSDDLTLKPSTANLGFVALLSDTHSRRAKYMQALALGLPCLHHRWLSDCVVQERILPFAAYLLPAGASDFLSGAVRSRSLTPYDPSTALLKRTFESRTRLLSDGTVILVTGKGNAKRKPYVFLTYALGAAKVVKVPSIDAAKDLLRGGDAGGAQQCDWIYVDGKVKDAQRALFGAAAEGRTKSDRPKKGARKGASANELLDGGEDADRAMARPRVVGDEFVIQSLILGALLDA